jgi:hypothetical protein
VVKVKVDFHAMKAHTGNIGIPPPILNFSTVWKVSLQSHAPAVLLPTK